MPYERGGCMTLLRSLYTGLYICIYVCNNVVWICPISKLYYIWTFTVCSSVEYIYESILRMQQRVPCIYIIPYECITVDEKENIK